MRRVSEVPLKLSMILTLLLVFASVSVFKKSVLVSSSPSVSGDWVVTGSESYYGDVFVLNGSLIVESGGDLTFREATLKLNCSYEGQYGIDVKSGGKLHILEDSIVTSVVPGKGFSFCVQQNSTFRMSDSELHGCGCYGHDWRTVGLCILSDDALIENSLISHNPLGIFVSSSGAIIRNSNITANDFGVMVNSGSPTICNNTITSNQRSGIAVGGDTTSPVIVGNLITKNGEPLMGVGGGIDSMLGASPIVLNNTITLNFGEGIFCNHYGSPTISGNVIASNEETGIGCVNQTKGIIRNNNITTNGRNGISCDDHSDILIQYNDILQNNGSGISVSFSNGTIQENVISFNGEGIGLHYSYHALVENNTVTSNYYAGIRLDHSNATVRRNNITAHNGTNGIDCQSSSPFIKENFFSNNSHGISSGSSNGTIQSNTFANCGDCIDLYWSNPIIQGNTITNNTGTGVWCTDHSNPTIQGNIITFNKGCGIGCRDGSQPEIRQNNIYGQENYGVANEDDSVTVNATHNYWGSKSGPIVGPADAVDPEEIAGNILYNPWLATPIIFAEITNPLSGDTVSATVKMSAEILAKNGISEVEFLVDNQLEYSDSDPPYEWEWNTAQYDETMHEISVRACDTFGLAVQVSRTVFVDNTPPMASIKEPLSGAMCHQTVAISVNATDNREVSNVRLKVDNGTWLVMTYNSTGFLWKHDLNTANLYDGQHTIMVLVLDKAGNPSTTAIGISTDNTPPALTIQSPTSGMTIGMTLNVNVQASDASNVSRIEFYLQDVLVYTVYSTPYQWSWDTTKHPNGEYAITVKAYDSVGNLKTNETTVTVKNIELPWWQAQFWTILQVLVATGGLVLAMLTYLRGKRKEKDKKAKK